MNQRLEATQKRRPLLFGEACPRCRKSVWLGFEEGAGSTPRGKRPVPAAHPRLFPQSRTQPSRAAGQEPKGMRGGGAPSCPDPPPRPPPLSARLALGKPSRGWTSTSESPGASVPTRRLQYPRQEGATASLAGGRPPSGSESAQPCAPPQATPHPAWVSPARRPSNPALTTKRLRARPPRAGRAPWGRGRYLRARGAHPGSHRRTGALAPALPHRRPLRTPTRTRGPRAPGRLSGGRERGSPRNPWNEEPPAVSKAPPGSARPGRPRPQPRPRPSHRAGGAEPR